MTVKEHYSDNVLSKARQVPKDQIVVQKADPSVYLVMSTRTGRMVRVQFIFDEHGEVQWRTCTCTNGNKRGGQTECYHAAAAEMVMEEKRHG